MVNFLRSSLILLKSSPRSAGALSWVLALVIIVLSLTPLQQLPDVPGGDKSHHLIAYAALAFPNALARPRQVFFFALIYAGLGGGIELIQPYANRYCSWLDFAANLAGVGIGTVCGIYLAKYLDRVTPGQNHPEI